MHSMLSFRRGGSSNTHYFDHLVCSHVRTSLPSRLSLGLNSMLSLLERLKLPAGFLNTGCRGRYLKGLKMLVYGTMVDTSTPANTTEGPLLMSYWMPWRNDARQATDHIHALREPSHSQSEPSCCRRSQSPWHIKCCYKHHIAKALKLDWK